MVVGIAVSESKRKLKWLQNGRSFRGMNGSRLWSRVDPGTAACEVVESRRSTGETKVTGLIAQSTCQQKWLLHEK